MVTHNSKLVSTELSLLWTTYIQDSSARLILNHFQRTREDTDLEKIITYASDCSNKHISQIKEIFSMENIPIPKAFTDENVNLDAPKLFTDIHMYRFLEHMSRSGLTNYSFGLSTTKRGDIRKLASECLTHSDQLYNMVIDDMLRKGILVRSPSIPYPTKVEFVQKTSFFADEFLNKNRPLLSVEIAHLGTNIEANYVVATTLLGYCQVAKSKKLKDLLYRGFEISKKHAEIFSSILRKEGVHAPGDWDSGVTGSTTPTFTDYLIVNNVASMISIGISNYGTAVGASLRKDIGIHYTRLIAELAAFAEDLAELMIKNTWMEKPPQMLNHKKLATD